MTVDEFCSQIGISRQKFYRFVKDPRRFTDEHVRSIIEVLSLSDADIATLESFLYSRVQKAAASDTADYDRLISRLLRRKLWEELSLHINNIEYIERGRSTTMESAGSLARIMAGFHGMLPAADDVSAASKMPAHEFMFTIYNCIPEVTESSGIRNDKASDCILTIARLVRELENILSCSTTVHIRVRHFLTDYQSRMTEVDDIGNKEAMLANLRLLNAILPLLSSVEDYSVGPLINFRHLWRNPNHLCLIRHTCVLSGEPAASGREAGSIGEYYLLVFTDIGSCYACRLGSVEAEHIYRFYTMDSHGKDSIPSQRDIKGSPNQVYYQLNQQSPLALIHPDLCFDDVPREMWLALLREVNSRSDKALYEAAFRTLIDPNNQYAFLGFEELVMAGLDTLDQRAAVNRENGKIVICHPEGLAKLVRTGIITDLVSEGVDLIGQEWSHAPLRFPAPMVRQLLELIRSSILKRHSASGGSPNKPGRINYYILHPKFPYPEITYILYRDLGAFPILNEGRHKNTITNMFPNPLVGMLMYNYVTEKMLGRQGERLESDILSDEHSIALIDKLIAQLDREQNAENRGNDS